MVIVYRVIDKTLDSSRVVEGRVSVTVRDRPDRPENVHATATGPGRASVSFTPGADNGARITQYMVTSSQGGGAVCEQTVCEVSGLTNGAWHKFTVVARNAVGDSDPSEASAEVQVDATPAKMAVPTLSAGNGQVTVTWSAPDNEGSPITKYEIAVNGGDGSSKQTTADASATSATIGDLENGVNYTVSIVARNGAEKQAEWSQPANTTPHGKPDPASAIALRHVGSSADGSTGSVDVSWKLGRSGGTNWGATTVTVDGKPITVDGSTTSVHVDGVTPGNSVSVTVDLSNAEGDHSTSSQSFSLSTVPMPIGAPTLEGTGKHGELVVRNLNKAPGNGFAVGELSLRYSSDSGSCVNGSEARDGMIIEGSGIAARTYYFCQVGLATSGETVASTPVRADGQPIAPPTLQGVTVSKAGPGAVRVNVAVAEAYPAMTELTVTVAGQQVNMLGSQSVVVNNLPEGAQVSAHVVAKNSQGEASADSNGITTELGVSTKWVENCSPGVAGQVPGQVCHTFNLVAPGFTPNASVEHVCRVSSDVDPGRTYLVKVGGPEVESGVPTRAGSQAELNGAVRVESCEPGR
jgi:hypothetical protein